MITLVNLIARLTRQWVFLAMCTLSVALCSEFEEAGGPRGLCCMKNTE